VLPSQKALEERPTEAYNSVLALKDLVENSSAVFLLDNQALENLA